MKKGRVQLLQGWIQMIYESLWQNWVAWAVFVGYLVGTWVAASVARRVMRGIVAAITARSNTTLDDRLGAAASSPVRWLVWALGLRLALEALGERIPAMEESAEFGWVLKVAVALVILAVTHLVNGLMRAAMDWYLHELAVGSDGTWDRELLPVFRRIIGLVLYFIAVTIILESFGQSITALVTTAGVASLAVALAAQETLSNMLGGFTILVDRPFKVGDVIELSDGKTGEVVEIGLRSTRIKQFDGNALIMPNKDMANSRVINFALPTPQSAIRQTIGVDYATDVEKAKQVLLDVLSAHPEVLKDPGPGVWFTKFGENSLDLFVSCWVASYRDRFRVADELNLAILKAFREHGINIPIPQRDVHLYVKNGGGLPG